MKHHETLLKHCETSQNTRTLAIQCDDIGAWHGNIGARHGNFGACAEFSGDIADCGLGITPQMCNRVTNHADMSTFSKQGKWDINPVSCPRHVVTQRWQKLCSLLNLNCLH